MSVPNRGLIVSKNDLTRWNDPRKIQAVAFHEFNPLGSIGFQLHECGYLEDCGNWNYDGLCSPFWRFYSNGKEGAHVKVNGRRIPLLPDQALLIPENVAFDSRGAAGTSHLWIHFSPPLTLGLVPDVLRLPMTGPLRANVEELRDLLRQRIDLQEFGARRLYHACFAVLHGWLADASLKTRPPLPPQLILLLEYIDRSLGGDLSNAVLARQVGMSVEGHIRWFKEGIGLTPARYVAKRRIREACRLLSLSELSIEEIAESVGFANRHHFSRVFLRYTERSPGRFRREQSQR
jgi:AraC-like DNA-binding protein